MYNKKRITFWILFVLFVAGSGGWMFYVPKMPDALYAPIPLEARLVTSHQRLNMRWAEMVQNPFVRHHLPKEWFSADNGNSAGPQKTIQQALDLLASDEVVLSYTPRLNFRGHAAWVATSWLGGKSQLARMWLLHKKPEYCRLVESYAGHPVWRIAGDAFSLPGDVCISLVEGMLIACLSEDPQAIRWVLEQYDGRYATRSGPFARRPIPHHAMDQPETWDKGWIWRMGEEEGASYSFALTALNRDRLGGIVDPGETLRFSVEGSLKLDGEPFSRVLGPLPLAVLVATPASAEAWMDRQVKAPWSQVVLEVAAGEVNGPVVLALTGGEVSGRYKGLRVPGLLLGLKLRDPLALDSLVSEVLDRLNAEYRWGLITGQAPVGDTVMYRIEGTTGNDYAELPPGERVAFCLVGDWLVVASNADALEKVLEGYAGADSAERASYPWAQGAAPDRAGLSLWVDFAGGSRTFRDALSVYALGLPLDDEERNRLGRQRVKEWKQWIDKLATLSRCRVWIKHYDEGPLVHIEAENLKP